MILAVTVDRVTGSLVVWCRINLAKAGSDRILLCSL